jgi:PAS domain S-box-containing protein
MRTSFNIRDSISRKLTAVNMLVSGAAVVLACAAFFTYDLGNARRELIDDLSIQAQIVGYNSISPLVFNDPQSAEKTLSALQASPHIVYAGIYNAKGQFFAGYWRDAKNAKARLPLPSSDSLPNRWIKERQFVQVQPIIFDGKPVGAVYIRSDLQGLIDRVKNYLIILAVILVISLCAALLVSQMSQRVISQPIGRLAETARLVSRDRNYSLRAPPPANRDEIAVLIGAFNEMLAEIQKRDTTLEESERQFRTLADSVPQLAWMAEPDGTITWYNRRWYDYTGTTPEQMQGWGWQSVHDPKVLPDVLVKWRNALDTGQPLEMVFPLRAKDGSFRDFLTIVVPVRDAFGKVARWFGTNTDITEQLRSEEALRRTEKLAATGRLAASIAHEINNPLEAVTNLLYLARKHPANAQTYLTTADNELDRIAEITKHTLGFYRDTSTPIKVNIAEVIHEVLALYSRKLQFKKIAVTERHGIDTEVTGFPGELRQIFANLVANAIEAMPENGRLVIKVSKVHERNDGNRPGVRVSLMDNGSGIENARLAKIFEPFYTTRKDVGTGLGLWLTQDLVQKHQGSIRVRSRVSLGKSGTVFSIFLPLNQAEDEEHSPGVGRQPVRPI